MFSGGLDSTGALWKLLNESTERILVHHMNLKNAERRARAESIAVTNLVQRLRQIRNFGYTESTHEYTTYNNTMIFDNDLANFIAGTICQSLPTIQKVALGMTASDTGDAVNERAERGKKILSAFTNAQKIYPVQDLTKIQIYNLLPQDVRDMTWSCRTPIYNTDGVPSVCNQCKACIEMKSIKTTLIYNSEIAKYL